MTKQYFSVNLNENNTPVNAHTRVAINVYDFAGTLVSAMLAVAFILIFIFRVATVEGTSMVPTLNDQDKLIISNLTPTYKYGDIVVVSREGDVPLIKRVIAVAGDKIDIDFESGIVSVNDEVLYEKYIAEPTHRSFSDGPLLPLTVPKGYVFVMGDNRNNSLDSRSGQVGLINTQRLVGKMVIDFNDREAK